MSWICLNPLSHPSSFYVFMLQCFILDESHMLWWKVVQLDERLTFIEELVSILATNVKWFYFRYINVVKVSGNTVRLRRLPRRPCVIYEPSIPTFLNIQYLLNP